jgi:DNA-directed RNA polymerase specialized sigma24 family protein
MTCVRRLVRLRRRESAVVEDAAREVLQETLLAAFRNLTG